MPGQLDEVIGRLTKLPVKVRSKAIDNAKKATEKYVWIPNPGPQTEAYLSKADVLLYGGEPGGGKSDLLLGCAFNAHDRSLIMRRQYTDMGALLDRLVALNKGRDGYNGSSPPSLQRPDGKFIELGAARQIGDEQHFQGHPHSFIGIDEATQFALTQIRFLPGWLRSTNPKQRCRVILATNPPLSAEGLWVVEMFAPWLDDRYDNPAKPGELRWVLTDADGNDKWVEGPSDTLFVNGKEVFPLSRTYIPASVSDNPYYAGGEYERQLNNLIEPYRSILLGKFKTLFRDLPNQIIPSNWVKDAQARWTKNPPSGVPMCAIGADVAQGGGDETVLAARWDGWYDELECTPGSKTPYGRDVAGLIVSLRRDSAVIIVDMGGGFGGSVYEHLQANDIEAIAYKGAEGTTRRTTDGKMRFTNVRTAALWAFREALDPGQPGGSTIALPHDSKLVADLTAPTFEMTPNGIKAETKEDVCERLGRSTDRGDAVIMSWWGGPKEVTNALDWIERQETKGVRGRLPKVVMGRSNRR